MLAWASTRKHLHRTNGHLKSSQIALPPNHPDLATSYNNIGLVYDSMGEYEKALSYYEKDHWKSSQIALPPNHPDLATSYNNIGLVYASMGEYEKALASYERPLEIKPNSSPSESSRLGYFV